MSARPAERHAALCKEIAAHDHRYYVLDDPSITDQAYDALLRELRDVEAAHPELVSPDSPTQRVSGTPREGFRKVERAVKMYSLDNAYAAADVAAVLAALAKTSGNVGAAADLLGIPRRTLDRRIVTLGLREHLSATYPRAGRQPRRPQNRTGA